MIRSVFVAGALVLAALAASCAHPPSARSAAPEPAAKAPTQPIAKTSAPSKAASAAAATSMETVTWDAVRKVLASRICLVEDADFPEGRPSVGEVDACGAVPHPSVLERAVDEAFEQAKPLMAGVGTFFTIVPANWKAASAAPTAAEKDRVLSEAYLGQDRFLPTVMPRLQQVFEDRGLRCPDCPSYPAPARRVVSWSEFAPYLKMYLVTDFAPKGKDGAPGKTHFGIVGDGHIVDETAVDHPEPQLMRAAWVTIVANIDALMPRASAYFNAIMQEDGFKNAGTDAQKVVYLRKSFKDRLSEDEEVHTAVCSTLTKYSRDLGVELKDCMPARSARFRAPSPGRSTPAGPDPFL